MLTKLWLVSLVERDHLEDLGIDEEDLTQTGLEEMDWIHLARDKY
jgi:hypothetical protein